MVFVSIAADGRDPYLVPGLGHGLRSTIKTSIDIVTTVFEYFCAQAIGVPD